MTARPGVGVGVLVERDGTLLLVRRQGVHGHGTWSTPGGHLDFGEAPEDCAVREVREETGVEIRDVTFEGVTNDLFVDEGRHYVTLWFRAAWASGDPHVAAPEEMSDVGWFPTDDLPSPLFLSLRNLLDGPTRHSPPTPRLTAVHPVLGCRDVRAAVAFYRHLGFRLVFQDDPSSPRYAGIARDDVELHLQWHDASAWQHPGDRPVYRFAVDDPDALWADFQTAGTLTDSRPVRDTPWGTREFHVRDPDGNGLQFYRDR